MIRDLSFPLAIGFACFTLASCATVKQQIKVEPASWTAEQHKRQQIETWEIRGRLGIQTEFTGGSLDVIWKNDGNDFSIRLIAPMGAGNYLVQGDENQAEIRFPNGSTKIINNIDNVFSSMLEVDLPTSAVKDWIRGIPSKTLPVEQISWDKKGHLNRIKQAGWSVEMTKYSGDKVPMPHNIYLSRDGESELDMRLILRQWLIDN
jgi:outer membrane lipoprotein LolB